MSSSGASALSRLAQNPDCEILSAMVMRGGSEARFYRDATGREYDREFGERLSSRRRGAQFEQNAFAGDARLLREVLSDFVGLSPDEIRVRNFMDDFPGTREDARVARLRATRAILQRGVEDDGPHLLIQPQLLVPTRPGQRPYFFVAPDIMVFDRRAGCYLPGDLKSFVVRENELSPGDLRRVRLQLAAQNIGLTHEYAAVRREISVPPTGLLIFSKPNGLHPHAPRLERLGGAIEAVRTGIIAYVRHRERIEELGGGARPHAIVDDLEPNFQEDCLSSCVMAQFCRARFADAAIDLGDDAAAALGEIGLARIAALAQGTAAPEDEREVAIAAELRRIRDELSATRAA